MSAVTRSLFSSALTPASRMARTAASWSAIRSSTISAAVRFFTEAPDGAKGLEALLDKMRAKVPDIAVRTTLLAGHPGETPEDFEEMLDFVEKNRFERLGIFTYSHEENTHSYNFEDDVPDETKQERANAVMDLQEEISMSINEEKIGKEYKVLIDRMEGGTFIGRTEHDSPEVDNEVIIPADHSYLRIGDFAQVKITDATAFDLYGEPIKP